MAYLFLALSLGMFIVAIKLLGIVPKVKNVISTTHAATATMKSRELSEEQKEAAVQKAAVEMFGAFISIFARVLLTLAVPITFVMFGSFIGLYSTDDAVRAASDWYFIVGSTILMIGALAIVR